MEERVLRSNESFMRSELILLEVDKNGFRNLTSLDGRDFAMNFIRSFLVRSR